ncbi:MAG TPA: manganese catalase family protein [Candidatus Caldiarchaeum subterraneum]|uniref:Manganese catalase family protein n=1 Tax=Caldiarchaeum subterraneum TaxID=311458 RepID=A0A833EC04_CALS0|nr:manganese catalase family protein [Candidatus Caldarchaeum subterraneum]
MYLRIDKLQVELPVPEEPDPKAAAVLQELLGGRFGEMSTLMNYTYQSFNFRGRKKLRPYYDLIANIATEELAHIEYVATGISILLNGAAKKEPPSGTPLATGLEAPNKYQFLPLGLGSVVGNSMGAFWSGEYVFASGNLVLDLLHNFFLECGARLLKIRVYQMTENPVVRTIVGYGLVRGGVHATAYAKALETLTGVEMTKLLPIPRIDNSKFPETIPYEKQGLHRILYRFSPNDYKELAQIWRGMAPTGDGELTVVDGPPEGFPIPDLPEIPETYAPEFDPEELANRARKFSEEFEKAQRNIQSKK